jgi:hypothetical protein
MKGKNIMSTALNAAYRTLQAQSGLKIGNRVQCTGRFDADQGGSKCKASNYHGAKSGFITYNRVGVIEKMSKHSVRVRSEANTDDAFNFPCFMLRKIGEVQQITKRYFCGDVDVTNEISSETKRKLDAVTRG